MNDPTHCDRCKSPLRGGWSQRFSEAGEVLETLCIPCRMEERITEYAADHILTSRLHMDAACAKYDKVPDPRYAPVLASMERLYAVMKDIEAAVWFGGLQALVQASDWRQLSAEHQGLHILCLASAGRVLITLHGETEFPWLTLIAAEDAKPGESGMGIQGISATEEEAHALLARFRAAWTEGARPSHDPEVRLAGL